MKKSAGALTLVEILVVLAIFSLLMAVLVPVMSNARKNATRIVCSTQLSQIALAIGAYAADYNGNIVKARTSFLDLQIDGFWNRVLLPYISREIKGGYFENDPELWYCPEDDDPHPAGFLNCPMDGYHKPLTSYALNGYYEDRNGVKIKLGPAGGFKFAQICQPAECMLMGETSYASQFYDIENPAVAILGLRPYGHHRMTSGFYHGNLMNVLFVDGHVDNIKGKMCPEDSKYIPKNYAESGYMFWPKLRLPTSSENPKFWGPGYGN